MQFIKSKFPELDEITFAQEALVFEPKKKVMKEVPDELRCCATKKDGERCTKKASAGLDKCSIHLRCAPSTPSQSSSLPEKVKCAALTKKNEPCKKYAIAGQTCCSIHAKMPQAPQQTQTIEVC